MSINYNVGVVFEGFHGSLGHVSRAFPEVVLSEVSGVTTVRAKLRAPGRAAAVSQLVERVTKAVPTAVPLRVDQDLVSVSDLAQRGGRTREPVRLLVDGKRGPGSFPASLGVVGDGIRI
jgi:hypothetical protein